MNIEDDVFERITECCSLSSINRCRAQAEIGLKILDSDSMLYTKMSHASEVGSPANLPWGHGVRELPFCHKLALTTIGW